MNRFSLSCFLAFIVAGPVLAQENRLPKAAAQRYAKLCVDHVGTPYAGQITTDVDATQPCAEQGEGGGAMVIPVKNLSKKSFTKIGKNMVPIGQLWLRKWVPVVKGRVIPKQRRRMVSVPIDDKDRPMTLLLLGIRLRKGTTELVVYGNGDVPLQVVAVKKVEYVQDLPISLEWQRGEKQIDSLTLIIAGAYQTKLHVTRE